MASTFTTKIQNGLEKIKAIIRSIIKDEHDVDLSAHPNGFNHHLTLTYSEGLRTNEPRLLFNTTVDSPIHLGAIYFYGNSVAEGWIDFDKSYDSNSNALMYQEITIHVDGHVGTNTELMALGYSFGYSARLSHEGRYIDVGNAVIQHAKVESVPNSDYDIANKKYVDVRASHYSNTPDYRRSIDITSTTYTAPSNGYVLIVTKINTEAYVEVKYANVGKLRLYQASSGLHIAEHTLIPVAKDDPLTFGGTFDVKKFIYCK